jgi:hypothetical protein
MAFIFLYCKCLSVFERQTERDGFPFLSFAQGQGVVGLGLVKKAKEKERERETPHASMQASKQQKQNKWSWLFARSLTYLTYDTSQSSDRQTGTDRVNDDE